MHLRNTPIQPLSEPPPISRLRVVQERGRRGQQRIARRRAALCAALLVIGFTGTATQALPFMTLAEGFGQVRATLLRISGPTAPGGVTGLAVLPEERTYNRQRLPAGTLLSMFGPVQGGEPFRIYALHPETGALLPSLAVSYGPAAGEGFPDAGLILLPDDYYLAMQFAPMAVVLGRFQPDGPGELLTEARLPGTLFPNGGGIGLLDADTLYVTSYARRELYTIDFQILGGQLSLGTPVLLNPDLGGPGPDGVAIIPENAAGELAGYAGNLILARFGGRGEGFVDIVDPAGNFLRRFATYDPDGSPNFIGPDGVTFGPDGSLYVSDFDRTIFRFSTIPEPGALLLMALMLAGCRPRSSGFTAARR